MLALYNENLHVHRPADIYQTHSLLSSALHYLIVIPSHFHILTTALKLLIAYDPLLLMVS